MNNYINTEIANVIVPRRFTLSANPNYVVFENKSQTQPKPQTVTLQVKTFAPIGVESEINFEENFIKATRFSISEKETEAKTKHVFWGTTNPNKVATNIFMVKPNDVTSTAENVRACLMKSSFIRSNFNVTITPTLNNQTGNLTKSATIVLEPKGIGKRYNFTFENDEAYQLTVQKSFTFQNTVANDSIGGGNEIALDIYTETGKTPGDASFVSLGRPMTTLSKTYVDRSVWFDLNTMFNTQKRYSNEFLTAKGWCDAGTATNLRFVAQRNDGVNNETFYVSDVIYALNGYMRNLEKNDLESRDANFVFDPSAPSQILPLTLQPVTTHIVGQRQYFNFLFANPQKATGNIGIIYSYYTQSGQFLGRKESSIAPTHTFKIVNTLQLDLDGLLTDEKNANRDKIGIIKVHLSYQKEKMSRAITFRIFPSHLHKVNDFAFLNSLGGWSAFNFGGSAQTEFKSKATTIHRAQTPGDDISKEIESVYGKEVDEQFTVETAPLHVSMIDWLKEISVSSAVYDLSTHRYVIVDDLAVKHSTKEDLYVLQMKYHYSDSYNANTK